MQETQVRSPSQEDPLEKGMATPASILAWEIPWTKESGRPHPMGSQMSWTQLSMHCFIHIIPLIFGPQEIPWSQPRPAVLPMLFKPCSNMIPKLFIHYSENTPSAPVKLTQAPAFHPYGSFLPPPGTLSPQSLWKSYLLLKGHLKGYFTASMKYFPSVPPTTPVKYSWLYLKSYSKFLESGKRLVCIELCIKHSFYIPACLSPCTNPVLPALDFSYLLVWTVSKVCHGKMLPYTE